MFSWWAYIFLITTWKWNKCLKVFCCQSYQIFFFIKRPFFSIFLLLGLTVSKSMHYFLMLHTLKLAKGANTRYDIDVKSANWQSVWNLRIDVSFLLLVWKSRFSSFTMWQLNPRKHCNCQKAENTYMTKTIEFFE